MPIPGHYYAFIRDRTSVKDKWYSFNDAEVKIFDPSQIASECFGGEMSSRTYDQVGISADETTFVYYGFNAASHIYRMFIFIYL